MTYINDWLTGTTVPVLVRDARYEDAGHELLVRWPDGHLEWVPLDAVDTVPAFEFTSNLN